MQRRILSSEIVRTARLPETLFKKIKNEPKIQLNFKFLRFPECVRARVCSKSQLVPMCVRRGCPATSPPGMAHPHPLRAPPRPSSRRMLFPRTRPVSVLRISNRTISWSTSFAYMLSLGRWHLNPGWWEHCNFLLNNWRVTFKKSWDYDDAFCLPPCLHHLKFVCAAVDLICSFTQINWKRSKCTTLKSLPSIAPKFQGFNSNPNRHCFKVYWAQKSLTNSNWIQIFQTNIWYNFQILNKC